MNFAVVIKKMKPKGEKEKSGVFRTPQYHSNTHLWKTKVIEQLTERERALLMLAQQGKSAKEIADILFKSHFTIQNHLKSLFEKLQAHFIMEAIDIASNQRMIYVQKQECAEQIPLPLEVNNKRTRTLITDEKLQKIQIYLNEGLSNRKVAERVGISESVIRYWKKKKKLNDPIIFHLL